MGGQDCGQRGWDAQLASALHGSLPTAKMPQSCWAGQQGLIEGQDVVDPSSGFLALSECLHCGLLGAEPGQE